MSRALVGLAVLLAVARPALAEECAPDPCAEAVAFAGLEPASEAEVPTDGVLVLRAHWFGEIDNEAMLAGLTLAVERRGLPVAGTLAATDLRGVLLWRPAEPLLPGETYRVSGAFVNAGEAPAECAAREVEVGFEFVAAQGPAGPLVEPWLWVSDRVVATPIDALDALVCCDDAVPRENLVCGIDHGLVWSKGQCTSSRARARLRVELRTAAIQDEATASQWVLTLLHDGMPTASTLGTRFTRELTGPACFSLVRRSLATGEELVSEERCVGETIEGPLDEVPVDPMLTLEERCVGAPYTCEAVDGAWDPSACTPWSAGEDLRVGCGCTGGGASSGLALLALWPWLRRRRAIARGVRSGG